jgi:hypothetical protein
MAKVKILEPNNGKRIAVAGDIYTIVASKEDRYRWNIQLSRS